MTPAGMETDAYDDLKALLAPGFPRRYSGSSAAALLFNIVGK
jgi:hypothetical protein